jgi:hypothetical protein
MLTSRSPPKTLCAWLTELFKAQSIRHGRKSPWNARFAITAASIERRASFAGAYDGLHEGKVSAQTRRVWSGLTPAGNL